MAHWFAIDRKDTFIIQALSASQAIIEFSPSGEILDANDNFLKSVGYTLSDIKGRHHRIFCDPAYVTSPDYALFWRELDAGRFNAGEFKRFRKDGSAVWLQASYNPIRNRSGRVTSIIKFAADISSAKAKALDDEGKINAIYLSQAVIEFTPDGEVLTANDNFLRAFGYSLTDVRGHPHRMFCDSDFVTSSGYDKLWTALREGRFESGEYKRIGNGGRPVYIQAAYNPIFDDEHKVVKVCKFAVDITQLVEKRLRNEQLAMGVNAELGGVIDQISHADRMASNASTASNETSAIVNSVAAASEELSQSVRQIADSMTHAREGVSGVAEASNVAGASVAELHNTAEAMTDVVSIIQDIASQINLLALNATIESARAGEAGRGFAVVANEVKSLATQASRSTNTIATEIGRMQTITRTVVDALAQVSRNVNAVLGTVADVAGAIDQQSAVTGEISRNMQTAVVAVTEIATSLEHISRTFSDVGTASEQVKASVETLVA